MQNINSLTILCSWAALFESTLSQIFGQFFSRQGPIIAINMFIQNIHIIQCICNNDELYSELSGSPIGQNVLVIE